jgi:ribonuclease HI
MPSRPTATVICDASLDPDTGIAGWAGWVKQGEVNGQFTRGVLKQPASNSFIAEFLGIVNTIDLALRNGWIVRGSKICVQCDNKQALEAVEPNGNSGGSTQIKRAKHHLYKLGVEYDVLFYTKHVKGHTNGPDGRHRVNNVVDEMAKEAMREARNAHYRNRKKGAA